MNINFLCRHFNGLLLSMKWPFKSATWLLQSTISVDCSHMHLEIKEQKHKGIILNSKLPKLAR